MAKNKNFTAFIFLITITTIIVATAIKVYNSHIDNIYKVLNKKVCESAKKCYLENKCEGKIVKIDELITKKYLNKLVDPKTKEYIDGNIDVIYENNTCSVDFR